MGYRAQLHPSVKGSVLARGFLAVEEVMNHPFKVFIFILLVSVSLTAMARERRHVLTVLMTLEMIAVGLFGILCCILFGKYNIVFALIFLAFSVCEGAMGLGMLARISRGFGREKVSSLFFLKF